MNYTGYSQVNEGRIHDMHVAKHYSYKNISIYSNLGQD